MSTDGSVHEHTVNLGRAVLELGPLKTVEDLADGFLEVERAKVNSLHLAFGDEAVDHRDGEIHSVGLDKIVVGLE